MASRTITSCDRCKADGLVMSTTISILGKRQDASNLGADNTAWWPNNIARGMDLCHACFHDLHRRIEGFLEADLCAIAQVRDRIEELENGGMSTVDALRTVHQEIEKART